MSSSSSKPRPIHKLHRDLQQNPDDNEPSVSFENETFLPTHEDGLEDQFHRRLQSHKGTGSSFWRSTSTGTVPMEILQQPQAQPSFNSMPMESSNDRRSSANASRIDVTADDITTPVDTSVDKPIIGTPGAMLSSSWTPPSASSSSKKKEMSKQRTNARRVKMHAQEGADVGHLIVEGDNIIDPTSADSLLLNDAGSLSRNSSTNTADSPRQYHAASASSSSGGVLPGKSSSLIFPTGVETPSKSNGSETASHISSTVDEETTTSETDPRLQRKLNLLLDQCETVRFPFKKKLSLENMHLSSQDVPIKDLCGTSLGNSLHKLSLSGNQRLTSVPDILVQSLPVLKTLDLSQCGLVKLPSHWYLPQLKRLNLSYNRLTEFPEEGMLEGLPELVELNMYGNKVAEIILPSNTRLLSKLEILNLGYNDLAYLPDELDQFHALKTLKVQNNFLEKVPMRVCDMDSIRTLDVSSNPVIQPPIETCDRGICSMKRYYHCLRMEEQTKQKALEEVQKKLLKQKQKVEKGKARKKKFFSSGLKTSSPVSPSLRSAVPAQSQLFSSVPTPPISAKTAAALDRIEEPALGTASYKTPGPCGALNFELESTVVRSQWTEEEEAIDQFEEAAVREQEDEVTINDTLKVIFVGMALAGKTSMIKRLIEGKDAVIPKRDERTVGVDIYEWDPEAANKQIELEDKDLAAQCGDVPVKFSVWDFAGQHVYHATHELFFSSRALYVLVWDMGATNVETQRRKLSMLEGEQGAFKLSYDSSDEEDDDDFMAEEEARRADRALERDIDEKVQFWVDCIQSSAPGSAILPVASFDDYFARGGNEEEAKRRCKIMKQRLLKHEERRIVGIKERLKEYHNQNRADDEAAVRLRKLLCPYTRPKLIFGNNDDDSVVRVSGTKYTGFGCLTDKIVGIATGRDRAGWRYPIFRGHVGARIPRMRLQVRETVRDMRDRFKVVEWGFFLSALRERGLDNEEDISDALHFLTNIGELSYFGNVLEKSPEMSDKMMEKYDNRRLSSVIKPLGTDGEIPLPLIPDPDDEDEEDDDFDGDKAILSIDDTSLTASNTNDDGSLSTMDDLIINGLSQYVFLNPRWLVAAVACILRHDLDREIRDTRRAFSRAAAGRRVERADSFYEANLNCPVITAEDACLLWQAKKFTKKAADRAAEYSNNSTLTPFEFMQRVLIRFGVFVPIDLSIEKALLGGKEYATGTEKQSDAVSPTELELTVTKDEDAGLPQFFFLPSLLGPGEPSEAWTYKNTDSWKVSLCHSILFPDGVPPGLMERITASVLSSIYAAASTKASCLSNDRRSKQFEGHIRVKEILCWRTAFYVKLGMEVGTRSGELKESIVEIFTHLADRESHLCVGSDVMGAGMRRLILSGKGQVGDGGRKIWNGGYLLVIRAIQRVMNEYGGLEFEKQGFCPECLSKKAVGQASSWDWTVIRTAAQNGDDTMRCRYGHRVDTRLVTGPCDSLSRPKLENTNQPVADGEPSISVNDLLRGVVIVGLYNGKTRKIVRVGSGFIVDRKRGLIVTASHTLMNIWGDKKSPFGENYYGLRDGKVVIGIIPRHTGDETMAVFRYWAKIVAKDPSIEEKGECHSDVCVLKIVTRMENDVGGNGEGCSDEPETLLLNNPDAMKKEKLQQLKVTDKCELDEQVRILGYNQGGEGLLGPGESLNRYIDFARGYVCKKFATGEDNTGSMRHRFKPRSEIVVICSTIGGHSGGPCVNGEGRVIGILSRADPTENHRCYLVPSSEWLGLVRQAKNTY